MSCCSDNTSKCSSECTAPCSQRLTGMVKWFNNKSGFGFITVSNTGTFGGKDIFVHYSSIRVTNSQYKYLVQGEYVEFNLVKSENEKHEYHATDITGIQGGAIMCETRRISMAQSDRIERDGRDDKTGSSPRTDPRAGPRADPRADPRTDKPKEKRQYKTRPADEPATPRAAQPAPSSTDTDGFVTQKKRGPPRTVKVDAK